ncbi:hypothetical protein [Deinococcus aerophilus]|uniref:Uncharacterized protein n=1 Tax=Deinococcus aerophilus TaxID=522488 RepID=A0ABQ2GS14_9DEIO|nr:hypothetical protein [Deinococcus aerophilus]GGM08618.1 hypothetical protein GCM10010841_16170 [Deinococcus aerophilus]
MKTPSVMLAAGFVLTTGTASAATSNMTGTTLCVDNESFTTGIGSLGSTSATVAQALYDHFVSSAKAQRIPFKEMGVRACSEYAVGLDFGATTGTPRAWYGELNLWDFAAYASPDINDAYTEPVSIWSTAAYGVLASNDGLVTYLISEGKAMINTFLKAYKLAN